MMITAVTVQGDSGHEYVVTAKGNDSVTCTCPSYQYRGGVCKHITFVIDHLNLEKVLAT